MLPHVQYKIAPGLSGYTFDPPTPGVRISNACNTAVNFASSTILAPVQHSVLLSWKASTSTNLKGYYVYRSDTAGGAFTKISAVPLAGTMYTDNTIASGRTYYYATTAVNANNLESGYSNQVTAVVPTP